MPGPEVDAVSWGRFALASVTVLGLLSLLAFGLKYLIARGFVRPGGGPRAGRLGVCAATPVDARRRLVLARCDEKEYLLLVGGESDVLLASFPRLSANDDSRP